MITLVPVWLFGGKCFWDSTRSNLRDDSEQIYVADWDANEATYLADPVSFTSDEAKAGYGRGIERHTYCRSFDILNRAEERGIVGHYSPPLSPGDMPKARNSPRDEKSPSKNSQDLGVSSSSSSGSET